jgi:hypothetical protein
LLDAFGIDGMIADFNDRMVASSALGPNLRGALG